MVALREVEKKKKVYVAFMDLENVYDKVNWKTSECPEKFLQWKLCT